MHFPGTTALAFKAPGDSNINGRNVDQRRDDRVRFHAPVWVLWEEQPRQVRYAKAVSRDVSERGLGLQTSQPIAVGTYLSLRSERGELFGDAKVRHATKRGSQYVLGVEFGYRLLEPARDLVRQVYGGSGGREPRF